MTNSDFLSLVKTSCSEAVYAHAKQLVTDIEDLDDQCYELQEGINSLRDAVLVFNPNYNLEQ